MGVDWIPYRVEAGCSREELRELVRLEAAHFRLSEFSSATQLDPRLRLSEAEEGEVRRAYAESGPLNRQLLFKCESHRTSVVTQKDIFPVEWRTDAERTILPWELAGQLSAWQDYLDEIKQGGHRAYLRQLYVYQHLQDLKTVEVENLVSVAKKSLTASGIWALRPEVGVCGNKVLEGGRAARKSRMLRLLRKRLSVCSRDPRMECHSSTR